MNKQIWTVANYKKLEEELKKNQDNEFITFSKKIISTNYPMLGVRTPILTSICKKIKKTDIEEFINNYQTNYYEEVLLEGFVIANTKDIEKQLQYLDTFISKIDNWAVCDMTISRMKNVKDHKEEYLDFIINCLKSKLEFKVRFGFVLLLNYYVEEKYLEKIFELCKSYNTSDYYVQMAVAWLLSYCYLLNKEKTLDFINSSSLDTFTHNKAISKIRESLRVSKEEKIKLKKYMI